MPLVPYTADISTIHRLDTDNAIEEIQHCINQLRMDEPLLATEYICIDDQLPIERFTDDDIIATVQNEEEYENDSDNEYESQPIISVKVALESVDNLMQFVNDPPSGLVFDRKALSVLRLLKSDISRYQTDGLSQSQIDSFINVGTS
jgi:hypothetical protein